MRNLKKLFAVLLTVAMIASMMVPALAAAVVYGEEGLKLQAIDLVKGDQNGNLNLADSLDRIQGITLAIRAAGKDAAALALTEAEADAILADWTDADEIPAWGRPYAAYAIQSGMTNGVGSATVKVFAATAPMDLKQFLVFVLVAGMGYARTTQVTYDTAVQVAIDAGVITVSQALDFGTLDIFNRDAAIGVIFGAVSNGVNADGTKLIDALIASGAVDATEAAAAGFTVVASEQAVTLSATNLKEIVATFAMPVAKAEVKGANFVVGGVALADAAVKASDDLKTVTLTVAEKANGSEYEVKFLKALGFAADTTKTIRIIDNTLPTVSSVTLTGPTTFDIVFSEPIKTAGTILLNNGIYSAVAGAVSGNKVTVTIPELAAGSYDVKVTGFKDFADFSMIEEVKTLTYAKDTSAITATLSDIKQNSVKVTFNKAVSGIDVTGISDSFYHTFTAWKPDTVTTTDNTAFTLSFTTYTIPEGNFTLVVKAVVGDVKVKDAWNNELASDLVLTGSVTADKTAPTVALDKVDTEQVIIIAYSEAVAGATTSANYVIKDKDGKDVTKNAGFAVTAGADNKYTVDFGTKLAGGNYTLVISNIEDTALAPNKMGVSTVAFTITDLTAPTITKAEYVDGAKVLYVTFNEAMNASALDVNNYQIVNGATIVKPKTVTLFGDNKYKLEYETFTFTADGTLYVGQVADVAGNKVAALSTPVSFTDIDEPAIDSVKLVAKNKLEIVIDAIVNPILADKISITEGAVTANAAIVTSSVKDGKTTLSVTLMASISDQLSSSNVPTSVTIAAEALVADNGVKNSAAITETTIADGVAPSFVSIAKVTSDAAITFDESLATTNAALYAHDLVIVDKDGNVLVAGVDYQTSVTGAVLNINFTADPTGKVTFATKDSVTYIKDIAGNKANAFTGKELTY